MTQQEICLIRVLLGFALLIAGLFPLSVIVFGVSTTLWVWGIGYAGCFLGTLLLFLQGRPDTPSLQKSTDPELAALAPLLRKRLSMACPQMPPEKVADIVGSVLTE